MADLKFNYKNISSFQLLQFMITAVGLLVLLLYGGKKNYGSAVIISLEFLMFLVFAFLIPIAFKRRLFFDIPNTSFAKESAWFVGGFAIFYTIARNQSGGSFFSLFSIPKNQALSVVTQQAPPVIQSFIDNVFAPNAEELFFLIALPIMLDVFFMTALDKFNIPKKKFIAFTLSTSITAVAFALFHVGAIDNLAFLRTAMIFRALQITLYWGDQIHEKLIPWGAVMTSFALGSHQGNNIGVAGLAQFTQIMSTSIFGMGILLIFAIIGVSAIIYWIGIGKDILKRFF